MSDPTPTGTGARLGSRRLLLGAVVTLAIVVIVLVILLLTGGGGGHSGSTQAQRGSGSQTGSSQNAQATAAIEGTAVAYQKALNPRSVDNPCRYMTAVAQSEAMTSANPAVRAKGCAAVMRAEQNQQNVPLWQARPPGVTGVTFAQNVPVAGLTSQAPGAQAHWRASGYPPISFVHRGSVWLVASS